MDDDLSWKWPFDSDLNAFTVPYELASTGWIIDYPELYGIAQNVISKFNENVGGRIVWQHKHRHDSELKDLVCIHKTSEIRVSYTGRKRGRIGGPQNAYITSYYVDNKDLYEDYVRLTFEAFLTELMFTIGFHTHPRSCLNRYLLIYKIKTKIDESVKTISDCIHGKVLNILTKSESEIQSEIAKESEENDWIKQAFAEVKEFLDKSLSIKEILQIAQMIATTDRDDKSIDISRLDIKAIRLIYNNVNDDDEAGKDLKEYLDELEFGVMMFKTHHECNEIMKMI